jgi:hypothetical protein
VTGSASHWLTTWTTKRHMPQLYFIPKVYGVDINIDKADIKSFGDGKY